MNWYLAKIVFQIICGDGKHTPQFDEQLRLIQATSKQQAFNKAREIGNNEEDNFYNIHQQPVHWKFVNVSELYRMEELLDGAEIYSKINEPENAHDYKCLINTKAASIFNNQQDRLTFI
jgi:hypothetical protein